VYSLTKSPFLLGLTVFAEQFPSFIFSIAGGVAADRYNRYQIIKVMQILSMIQSVLLAILLYAGYEVVWAILTLSVFLGVINAFDVPARQSLLHEAVADQSDLPNAVSLTTATACLAQLLAPTASMFVVNKWGAAVCFLINAGSFGGVLLSILLMKLPPYKPKTVRKKILHEFAEGFSYLKQTPSIGMIIIMLALISLLVLPYNTVLPVFAKVVFSGNALTFGYIQSFTGVGAVIGTIFLASRKPDAKLKKVLFVSSLILCVALIFFALSQQFALAMLFATLAGFGSIAQYAISNIIVQSESAPEMRGRAIGVLLMAIFGTVPVGSLLVGAVSQHIGAPVTVLCEGIAGLAVTLGFTRFLWRPGNQ
jgi:MFS family permease